MKLSGVVSRLRSWFGTERQHGSGAQCSRGQTAVDYLVGISLVLVTILGTFVLVPMVFDPFEPAISPDKQSMADRLADDIVTNNTYAGDERTLNRSGLDNSFEDYLDTHRAEAGITRYERVNVTIQNGTGTRVSTSGDPFRRDAGGVATSVRTFTTREQANGEDNPCTKGCQLIVRVWNR